MSSRSKYTYLFHYNDLATDKERAKAFFDATPEISYWYTCMPHSFLIVSDRTAEELTTIIRRLTNDRGRFLVVDTGLDRNGWMPKDAWRIMRNPNDPWKHD